ncbi:MAG: YceI family protein, partial [Chitinophagaceae bacterium]|nr:YceI family protein [Chitinophagaceae bacterium]
MKKLSFPLLAMLAVLASCSDAPKADSASTGAADTVAAATGTSFSVDTAGSLVNWVGTKQTGQHMGTFKLAAGSFSVASGNITGGSFTINMASLTVTDLTGEEKGQLEGHLSSPDFFDVAKYPAAQFDITAVAPYDSATTKSVLAGATHVISGNLKLKDSTVNISFPAKVQLTGGSLSAEADFNIDRTQWGMNYKG